MTNMREPSLAVSALKDGTFIANLYVADKLRTVMGRDLPELGRRTRSALIGEFQYPQDEADAFVEERGLEATPTAAEHEALKARLADAQASQSAAVAKMTAMASVLTRANSATEDAKAQLAELTAQHEKVLADLAAANPELVSTLVPPSVQEKTNLQVGDPIIPLSPI